MLRFLDVVLAGVGLIVAMPLMALLYLVGLLDTGAPLFRQKRVGRFQKPFTLVKFRTMRPDTQSVATLWPTRLQSHLWALSCVVANLMNCRSCGTCSKGK